MTLATMYPGYVNSPNTTLTSDITDSATTVPVTELGVFPAAPNIAVIGTGEDAETILYGAKSAPTGTGAGNLTSVTREYDKTGTYGAKKAWSSGAVISRLFTKYDLTSLQSSVEGLYYENTYSISPSGGDYTTIQAALDANVTEYCLFLVYPGYYVDDTIHYTANNQSVIGMDNSTTQIVGSAATNVVDFGAFTGCVLNRLTVQITAATTSSHTVTGSTGNIIINDCTLEMTNASYTGATQPSVINITGAGTCWVKFGYINYTNTVAASAVKAAILLGTGSFVRLQRGDIAVAGAGASIGTTLSYGTSTGRITATRTTISITDTATTATVGFYIGGSATDDEITNCHIHVVGGAATGIWNVGSGVIRSFGNYIHVTGTTAYSFQVGASATIISSYDDKIAATGILCDGTYTSLPDDSVYLYPMGAIIPVTTPATVDQAELGNGLNYVYGEYSYTEYNALQWSVRLPNHLTTVPKWIVSVEWLTTSFSTATVMWDIAAVRTGNNATRDLVIPNIITITDTGNGDNYTNVAAGAATTITGSGDTLIVQVSRDYTTDALDATARLLSVRLTPVV